MFGHFTILCMKGLICHIEIFERFPTGICSKPIIKTPDTVWNMFRSINKDTIQKTSLTVSLLLAVIRFHKFFWCFQCYLQISILPSRFRSQRNIVIFIVHLQTNRNSHWSHSLNKAALKNFANVCGELLLNKDGTPKTADSLSKL